MELKARLAELARWDPAAAPVVSVYLNTRWADEQQRERVRIFLKNELRRAREAGRAPSADLEWIEAHGRALIEQSEWPEARGVALFACERAGLREAMPVRVRFDDLFVINDRPFLKPLIEVLDETPAAMVVFVDGTSARLIPFGTGGPGDELVLEAHVERRHSAGGWAALAQSRYQRHIEAHREQHYAAVAAAVVEWSDRRGAEGRAEAPQRIVLAGEPRAVAAFRAHLPERTTARIVGTVSAARYEPSAVIVERATSLMSAVDRSRDDQEVDSVLVEAAKAGHAVNGLGPTLEAVNRGAVRHLYLLRDFREIGRECEACAALQKGLGGACAYCGRDTKPASLDEMLIDRVIAAGGRVTTVDRHDELARRGGLVALLRYAT
jgi:peptide subunit release factor 1 (eRF1)